MKTNVQNELDDGLRGSKRHDKQIFEGFGYLCGKGWGCFDRDVFLLGVYKA